MVEQSENPREQRIILRSLVVSLVSVVLILGSAAGLAYWYRSDLFAWLASDYYHSRSVPSATTDSISSDQGEQTIIDIVEAADPAVVSVVVTQDVPVFEQFYEEYNPFGGFFGDQFQFRVPRQRQNGTEEREVGGGSGFFVSSDGLVVTNRHVVEIPDATYSILTNEGESFAVEVLARDPILDIAVLQVVDGGEVAHLSFGDSDALKLGQTVIAIGNALGEFRNSVSTGVVSGLSRSIVAGGQFGSAPEMLDEVIQTDAAINPGNSGGPLLNTRGEVIGVNVAVALGSENIGFSLPSNVVADIVASVQEFGEIRRPFLGVRYVDVNERIAEAEGLAVDYGALVSRGETAMDIAVLPDSPADRAGLQAGDVIIEIAGQSLREHSLASVIRNQSIGDEIELVVMRGNDELTLLATLEAAPE